MESIAWCAAAAGSEAGDGRGQVMAATRATRAQRRRGEPSPQVASEGHAVLKTSGRLEQPPVETLAAQRVEGTKRWG